MTGANTASEGACSVSSTTADFVFQIKESQPAS